MNIMNIKPMIYQATRKIELLYVDKYKDYKYYILNLGTHPTAYIEIPKNHKLWEKDYRDIDINVHGGLTYSRHTLMGIDSENWFIGWDYAHAGDYIGYYERVPYDDRYLIYSKNEKKWSTQEIIEDCKSVIDQIVALESEVG